MLIGKWLVMKRITKSFDKKSLMSVSKKHQKKGNRYASAVSEQRPHIALELDSSVQHGHAARRRGKTNVDKDDDRFHSSSFDSIVVDKWK